MKIVSCGKISVLNCGSETIILRFVFSLSEQYFIQSTYMRGIHVCFPTKVCFKLVRKDVFMPVYLRR